MSRRFDNWLSLSPWSIISFSFVSIKAVLSNGYALIPLLYTGWQQGFSSPWALLVAGGVVLATLTFSTLQWSMYRFRLNDGKLGVRQGLIFKKAHEIPLNKIQNVRLEQPLYFRPLGLFSLVVETAGSKQDEAVLAAVTYRQAMRLKRSLFRTAEQTEQNQPQPDANIDATKTGVRTSNKTNTKTGNRTIITKGVKPLIKFGLYQNNLFWLSVISGSILGQLDWEQAEESWLVQSLITWYQSQIGDNFVQQLLFAAAFLLLLYLLLSLISVASAVLKYYPYQLSLKHLTLHRSGGLIAKQQDALNLQRVQVIDFDQPAIAWLLRLWTVNFKQVKGNEVEQLAKRHMLIPSVTTAEITQLLPKLSGLSAKAQALPSHYQRIHITWFWRRTLPLMCLPLLITPFIGLTPFSESLGGLALIAIAALYLRYRQWGYLLEGDDCWIHTGVVGQQWTLVSLRKTQDISISQTPGQRRQALATLHLGLASGEQVIPYIPLKQARLIAETALTLTKQDHKNWI